MIRNEDSYAISQVAVVTNAITSDNEVDANDGLFEEDDQESFDNFQVPSTFTSIEKTNISSDGD